MSKELAADALRREFRVEGFASTAELAADEVGVIGQERAVEAMEFGLKAHEPNYNIFVAGPVGTGRSTYVRARLQQQAADEPVPPDWCYVFNFAQPERPKLLSLPAGEGRKLQREVERLVAELRSDLRRAFDSPEYEAHRSQARRAFEQRSEEFFAQLEAAARAAGFGLQRTVTGIATVPLGPNGQPLTQEAFGLLPEEHQREVMERGRSLEPVVSETMRGFRQLEREAREAVRELDRKTAAYVVGAALAHRKEGFAGREQVLAYLDALGEDVVAHLEQFNEEGGEGQERTVPDEEFWRRYLVNVFVDHGSTRGAPVVIEPITGLPALIGRVEFKPGPAGLATDFTLVRPGSLQRASGGYLVLQLKELLSVPGAYEALKRALRDGLAHLDGGGATGPSPFVLATLLPEPMPLDVRVVLIGPAAAYQALLLYDEDFHKLFKVKVEFDRDMPASPENQQRHAVFIAAVCRRTGTPHLSADGVERVLAYSARLAEDQTKLSTRFNEIVDLVVAAGILARARGQETATGADVLQAVRDKARRSGGVEEELLEMTRDGSLMVATSGSAPGQVNGLTVINLGDYAFGRPIRITARAWIGRRGIVHVERETQMSGRIHTKGVLTVAAYLAGRYAQREPLCLSASLAMEQMYEEVEGDSAASAELYALLSELAGVPVRQGIAVTGSVNQKGEVQPIGGVNEKIEGFFRACAAGEGGLTGEQGVLIPRQNVRNLALNDEVVEAVAEGRFHVWPVGSIDEGIEVLTGVPAGRPGRDGRYPAESIHGRVAARLEGYARQLEQLGARGAPAGEES